MDDGETVGEMKRSTGELWMSRKETTIEGKGYGESKR